MARQVSGSEKTLIQAIHDGHIETPQLMGWNAYQRWRREVGKRPQLSVDGFATVAAQESALWKAVMAEVHGVSWAEDLAARDSEDPQAPSSQSREPSQRPAADAAFRSRSLASRA